MTRGATRIVVARGHRDHSRGCAAVRTTPPAYTAGGTAALILSLLLDFWLDGTNWFAAIGVAWIAGQSLALIWGVRYCSGGALLPTPRHTDKPELGRILRAAHTLARGESRYGTNSVPWLGVGGLLEGGGKSEH